MSCPCDQPPTQAARDIPAGLSDLPRQLFSFGELKLAMLDRAKLWPALADWRARDPGDYGVMWLEMVAYLGELLSLYDQAIADESYVRTAKLRPSLRQLLELLGYVPRPAVAATVELALIADGAQPVVLPAGTGFRSGSFGSEAPQVFELTSPATIHPALNRWPVLTPAATQLTGSLTTLALEAASARVAIGDVVLVELSSAAADAHVRTVTGVARAIDGAGRRVAQVTLDRAVEAGAGKPVNGVRLRKASRTAALKTPSALGGDPPSFEYVASPRRYRFRLDGIYPEARQADRFLVTYRDETRWARADSRTDASLVVIASTTTADITIDLGGTSNDNVIRGQTVPAVKAVHTILRTDDDLDSPTRKATATSPSWSAIIDDPSGFTVGIGLISAGRVLGPPLASVRPTDPLAISRARPPVGSVATTARIILRDAEQRGVAVAGGVDLANGLLDLDDADAWTPGLASPLTAHGNVVTAVRGETVPSEVLGSGDASKVMQRFTLKKKPLTYVSVAGGTGVASSLQIWVDGLRWTEVPGFYGQGPEAHVYLVRQDDDGASVVIFGDGVRGARLPTGVDNVVASYRYGAGAASPPAGSIAQVAKPAAGLASVIGPVAAGGGSDAEDAESLRQLAPRSALLLGRAISIDDMEVAARLVPGVITARADWGWDGKRQRPVVQVWIVGGEGVVDTVTARLQALADPDTPIGVSEAAAVVAPLAIDLELDARQVAGTVLAAATDALLGDDGWLLPARLGIGAPLLRSPLIARLLAVPGVTGVRGLTFAGAPLLGYGVDPGHGHYYDLTASTTVGGS